MTESAEGRTGHSVPRSERPEGRRVDRRRWATLTALTLVTFLLLLDDTAVAVAMPAVQRDLGLDLAGQAWVINAYTLALAAFTLPAGRLADRYGRRRVFLIGLALFILASLAAGFAPNGTMLIAARSVQGLGAALVAPASLAIIATTFPGKLRGAAIGLWAGVSASALGLGPLFGAIVTDNLGWAWIFWLNVPLGAGAGFLVHAVVGESRAPHAPHNLDVAGAGLSAGALLGLLLALSRGSEAGWAAPGTVALFVAGTVGLLLFAWHESRTGEPLLDPRWFRDRSFAGANLQILLSTSVMCSLFFFLALYMQTVLGYTALAAGIALLPLTVTIVATGPLAGRLGDRIGARLPVTLGMLLLGGALLGLSGLAVDSSVLALIPWLTLAGAGIGLVTAPVTAAALGSDESGGYGATAAVFNTFRTTGLTLGVAIMGAILNSFGPAGAFERDFDRQHHAAFVDGFSTAVTVNAVIAFAAAAFAAYTFRDPWTRRPDAGDTHRASVFPRGPSHASRGRGQSRDQR